MRFTPISLAGRRRLAPSRLGVGLGFLALGLAALPFADLSTGRHDPWAVLAKMTAGFLRPDFSAVENLGTAAAMTLAFAFCGVATGAVAGFGLALGFGFAPLRWLAAALRSVHELIWALLLMAASGPSASTGVAALGLAYAGIFAKVYAEILDEADPRPAAHLPGRISAVTQFFYGRLRSRCRRCAPIRSIGSNAVCAPARCWASSACRPWVSSSTLFSNKAPMARSRRCCSSIMR
jgi:phosphonate transport system permease protein